MQEIKNNNYYEDEYPEDEPDEELEEYLVDPMTRVKDNNLNED